MFRSRAGCHAPVLLPYIHIIYSGKHRNNGCKYYRLYKTSCHFLYYEESNDEGYEAKNVISEVFHISYLYPFYLNKRRNCAGIIVSNSMRSRVTGCQKHST